MLGRGHRGSRRDKEIYDASHECFQLGRAFVVMQRFKRNEVQLLVATTVVEVGVDVPNASVMLIEHADRFGLSQLHQLRGRIGRGSKKSFCLLMADGRRSEISQERLKEARKRLPVLEQRRAAGRQASIGLR